MIIKGERMKLSYLFIPLMVIFLTFTGCGDDTTDDSCAYAVQQNLDEGNFDLVIASLENNQTCGGELSQEDAWLNLAAAYMGKSGLTMGNLLGAVTDSNSSDAMTSFMTSFATSATAEGLANMDYAKEIYAYISSSADCNTTQTGAKAEACLYTGMVTLTEAVGSLSAILGSETLQLLSATTLANTDDVNGNGKADGLDVTVCAISDANSSVSPCSTDASISFTSIADINFTKTPFSALYTVRTFTVSGTGQDDINFTKLIDVDAVIPSPVTTSGYCKTDFTACPTLNVAGGCYPCPVVINSAATTSTTGLLSIINGSNLDALSSFLPADDNNTAANITQDLKDSIRGTTGDANDITEAELAAFLQSL